MFSAGGPVGERENLPVPLHHHHVRRDQRLHALGLQRHDAKMIGNETHARTIGYGAMLIEGLVGVVAMIAAATLPVGDYYAMNTELAKSRVPDKFVESRANVDPRRLRTRTQELARRTAGRLRSRWHGPYLRRIPRTLGCRRGGAQAMWKYWYHFASCSRRCSS
jgi:carbon starvation protein